MKATNSRCEGVTMVEILIALVILGVMAAVAHRLIGTSRSADHVARDLSKVIVMARWRAVAHGDPVVVAFDAEQRVVVLLRGGYACGVARGATTIDVLELRSHAHLVWPSNALAFAPDGRPRSCSGGGVGSATIRIVDRNGNAAAVIVSALGRVRWERR